MRDLWGEDKGGSTGKAYCWGDGEQRLPHSTCAIKSNIGHSGLSVKVKESELSVGQKYGLKKASNKSQLD